MEWIFRSDKEKPLPQTASASTWTAPGGRWPKTPARATVGAGSGGGSDVAWPDARNAIAPSIYCNHGDYFPDF